ncbi:short chain dehydrogenase [Chitinophaga sp. XS-30]|uniref:short chain dehydrogenase n=1 Tax=Chitinophaga sp. XS-30 TaxID=2604421 RepID=UPI0011DD6117|nr:short chain dehydrogenase [Chitinophaga sp. XS-30]QEH41230.1 short chain dehydrogenase [Chitinophaga sp. XS-30]
MKRTIVVTGASGTIGAELSKTLEKAGHKVIRVSRSSGDYKADISDIASLETLFKSIGAFDAVANAAGEVAALPFEQITDESISFSIANKMMGQVNLVRTALPYIADKGSFALISGVLTDEPILGGVIGTMINGAVEGFVKATAHELPRGIRINCISPTVLAESTAYHPYFPGFIPVAVSKVVYAYERALLGIINGRILPV